MTADQYKFPMRLRYAMERAATVLTNCADTRVRELDEDSQALLRSVLDDLDSACIEANLVVRPAQQPASNLAELLAVGGQMASTLYNLAQQEGQTLHRNTCELLDDLRRQWDALRRAAAVVPIPMILHCPRCGLQHIDAPESMPMMFEGVAVDTVEFWENPPHRSHLCHGCGHIWRPADVPTEGVKAIQTRGKADSPITPAPASFAAAIASYAIDDGPVKDLQHRVLYSLSKGDPVAVAAYCMALWNKRAPVRDWAPNTGHLAYVAPDDDSGAHLKQCSQATTRPYTPIYQVWNAAGAGGWLDTNKHHYDGTPECSRRIVYEPAEAEEPPCHARPQAEWCDRHGPGGFMGHTCHSTPAAPPITDTERLDYIERHAVRGGTYQTITSVDIIVHTEDLVKGVRYAIDRMKERANKEKP